MFIYFMTRTSKRGFTLIELLVVIAIIGILASIILASLNTARQKGRDARRLSDLKQIVNAIALTDTGGAPVAFAGCVGASALTNTCTTPALQLFLDPSAPTGTACVTGGGVICPYTVGKGPTVATAGATNQSYEVCAFLETAAGPLAAPGMVSVSSASSGTIIAGCL